MACSFVSWMFTVYAECRYGWALGMNCLGELGRSIELNLSALMGDCIFVEVGG